MIRRTGTTLAIVVAVTFRMRDRWLRRQLSARHVVTAARPVSTQQATPILPEAVSTAASTPKRIERPQVRRRSAARPAIVVAVLSLAIAGILTPVAAEPYAGPPILEADPSTLVPGSSVSVTGRGFDAHQEGVLALDGDTTGMPAYRVRGNGSFVERFVVPADTSVGVHTVEALGPELIAAVTLTVVATATPVPTTAPTPVPTAVPTSPPLTSVDHVFVVVMENQAYDEVWNNGSTPYTTSLANANARAANYFAITHPSLPNYLDLFGGSDYGITANCDPSSSCHIDAANLADNLEATGLTWKGYFEDMPAPCYLTDSGAYRAHHNPFIYFDDIRTDAARCGSYVVNYVALSVDLATAATTPSYAMIVPNNCHNTHDCSIATGDAWLAANIPPLLDSPACVADTCLVVLTWDEDDGSQGNQVLTVFAGSAARSSTVSTVRYDHFDLLRTIEDLLGVSTQTSNDSSAAAMSDMLR